MQRAGLEDMMLPPSNMVDLRHIAPNTTIQDYCKSIKYKLHQQNDAFESAGGKIHITDTITDIDCSTIYELWSNVEQAQLSGNKPQPIIRPSLSLIQEIARMPNQLRSYMYLTVNDQIIATCILFRVRKALLTTDLQGLNYTFSKQYRAYFVMMAAVIDVAIREGFRIVDCGYVCICILNMISGCYLYTN